MADQFIIPDVSAEGIWDTSKVAAKSPNPLMKQDFLRSFANKYGDSYVQNCLIACAQLKLVKRVGDTYISSEAFRDVIARAHRSELKLVLRSALQDYPPFLLFADFISKGYSIDEASNMTRGILRIGSSTSIVQKSLRLWGVAAELIKRNEKGELVFPEAAKGLPAQYVKELVRALQDELKASIFLIETLSPQAYAYLTDKEISISELAKGLVNYEKDPNTSAEKAGKIIELFLYKFGEELGVEVKKCNGIMELSNAIRAKDPLAISNNQLHLCHGLGALRNMTAHQPDKETGKPWVITPHGALVTILSSPSLAKSVLLYVKRKNRNIRPTIRAVTGP